MKRVLVFLSVVVLAPIIAGIYGMLHDQLSYTISSEYYTHFKFIQFGFIENGENPAILEPRRFYVALVGWRATWWMGIPIGIILGVFGFMHKEPKKMFHTTFKSFLTTILIAFFTALIGLLYCHLLILPNIDDLSNSFHTHIYPDLIEPSKFIYVAWMHNFSYIGGATGLLAGIIHIFKQRKSN